MGGVPVMKGNIPGSRIARIRLAAVAGTRRTARFEYFIMELVAVRRLQHQDRRGARQRMRGITSAEVSPPSSTTLDRSARGQELIVMMITSLLQGAGGQGLPGGASQKLFALHSTLLLVAESSRVVVSKIERDVIARGVFIQSLI